jgi:hypothetical protein
MQQKLGSQSQRGKKTRWSKLIYPALAERLFFELDELSMDTKRKYSYREIAELMYELYDAKIHYSTICRWAHKFGWLELWDNAIKEGTLDALRELEHDKDYQEFMRELIEDSKKLLKELEEDNQEFSKELLY